MLQDLSLDSVTDSDLCHDGDGDSLHDSSDHTGVGLILVHVHKVVAGVTNHSCDTTIASDVGGDSLWSSVATLQVRGGTYQEP
jgi:hypothetical protein